MTEILQGDLSLWVIIVSSGIAVLFWAHEEHRRVCPVPQHCEGIRGKAPLSWAAASSPARMLARNCKLPYKSWRATPGFPFRLDGSRGMFSSGVGFERSARRD